MSYLRVINNRQNRPAQILLSDCVSCLNSGRKFQTLSLLPEQSGVIKSEAQDEPQIEPQIQPDNTTYQRCRVLLETIISKPYLTKEDLGKELGVSESTIKRDIDKLRKTYRITWSGPIIGGRWEVERLK